MTDNFDKDLKTPYGMRKFQFHSAFDGIERTYSITTSEENNKLVTFRMKKDEKGQWKILAQVLPMWIQEKEMELNDEIVNS
jgi:iron only hydrogenase large subunit-like protein